MERLRVRTKALSVEYEIKIVRKGLSSIGEDARRWLGEDARRVVVVSNPIVFGYYGPRTIRSLKTSGFALSEWLLRDGERFKSLATVQQLLNFLSQERLERSDSVLALGGGVVGDLAGFSASIYQRGIRFVYVPTTLLAQIDASVGGKTGVNLPHGKNLVGTFHQPSGVLSDVDTLKTLPPRELVSGCCEIVKQGAVASRELFYETLSFLKAPGPIGSSSTSSQLEKLIAANCSFKASIVANDERENPERADSRSRKILNFGHTSAHAIEALTRYRRFRHGEAVGVGILIAGELSKNLGLLSVTELELLTEAVGRCGPLPGSDDLDVSAIVRFIQRDKKSVGGHVQWVLLERIGRARILSGQEIPSRLLRHSIREGLRRASTLRTER